MLRVGNIIDFCENSVKGLPFLRLLGGGCKVDKVLK